MYPSQHLILGTLFALVLLAIFPQIGFLGVSLIVLSTFFVDVDHYFLYVCRKKDLSLKDAYRWFREILKRKILLSLEQKKKYQYEILIFHGVEFWGLLFVLGLFSIYFMYFFIGVMFHMFLDFLALIYLNEPLNYKLSQIYNHLRNRGRKSFA